MLTSPLYPEINFLPTSFFWCTAKVWELKAYRNKKTGHFNLPALKPGTLFLRSAPNLMDT